MKIDFFTWLKIFISVFIQKSYFYECWNTPHIDNLNTLFQTNYDNVIFLKKKGENLYF